MRPVLLFLFTAFCAYSQHWTMFHGDPQRTGWARGEQTISSNSVKQMKLGWSVKLDVEPRHLNSLTVPVVVRGVPAPGGFRDIVLVATADDRVYALDADSGKVFWKKQMDVQTKAKNAYGWLCPGALNATPVMDRGSRTVYLIASDGKLHTFNYVNGEETKPAIQFVPPFSKNWSLNLVDGVLYTTISQGCEGAKSGVYALDTKTPERTITKFLSTTAGGAGIWGRAGAAITSKGLVVVETGDGSYDAAAGKYPDSFLALKPGTLELSDYYTPSNRAWITKKDLDMGNISPIVFPFKGKELIAGSGKEGVIYLLDAEKLGGADHRTPLYRSPLFTNEEVDFAARGFWGALSTWEDADGTRWLLAPAYGPPTATTKFPHLNGETPHGSIMAFKVVETGGKPALEPAWASRDLAMPEPAIIANGVVFALANGEDASQVDSSGRLLTSKERMDLKKGNAVLYALDARTGKTLWSSGDAMKSFTHFSGIALSEGRVFTSTFDGTVYGFTMPEER